MNAEETRHVFYDLWPKGFIYIRQESGLLDRFHLCKIYQLFFGLWEACYRYSQAIGLDRGLFERFLKGKGLFFVSLSCTPQSELFQLDAGMLSSPRAFEENLAEFMRSSKKSEEEGPNANEKVRRFVIAHIDLNFTTWFLMLRCVISLFDMNNHRSSTSIRQLTSFVRSIFFL